MIVWSDNRKIVCGTLVVDAIGSCTDGESDGMEGAETSLDETGAGVLCWVGGVGGLETSGRLQGILQN